MSVLFPTNNFSICIVYILLYFYYIAYRVSMFFSVDRVKKQYEKEEIPNNDRRDAVQSLIRSSQNGPGCWKGGRTESRKRESLRRTSSQCMWHRRDTWRSVRGAPTGDFLLSEFSRATTYPLCSSRYPLIDIPRQEMRYRGNDTYVSERRNRRDAALRWLTRHSDQWITHGSISSRFPTNFEIRIRVYQIFLVECIETCLTLYIFNDYEKSSLRITNYGFEREKGVVSFTRVEY